MKFVRGGFKTFRKGGDPLWLLVVLVLVLALRRILILAGLRLVV